MQNYRCNHDKVKKKDKGTSSKHKLSYRADFLTLDWLILRRRNMKMETVVLNSATSVVDS